MNYPESITNNLSHINVWIYIYIHIYIWFSIFRHHEQDLAIELQKVIKPTHQITKDVFFLCLIYDIYTQSAMRHFNMNM